MARLDAIPRRQLDATYVQKIDPSPTDENMNLTLAPAAPATRVKTTAFAAIVLFLFPAFTGEVFSQRDEERPNIEELLPETTVAFVQIPDIRSVIDKTNNGTFGSMMEDESIAPLRERITVEVQQAYSEKAMEEVGLSLDELGSIPSGEMVVAMIAPRRSKPVYMVILEIGHENEAAEKAYEVAMQKVTNIEESNAEKAELESGVEVERMNIDGNSVLIAKSKGLIVGCSDEKVLNDFFVRWDGGQVEKVRPLSQNRKFITIMNRCRSQKDLPADFKFFFDPIAIAKSSYRGDMAAQVVLAMFPSIGLDSVLALGGSMILDDGDFEWMMHSHLLLSDPRKGVTKMISLKPADYHPEAWVPFDAINYLSTSWDVPQMMAELRDLLDLTVEEGTYDNLVANQIEEPLGVSFEEDILPNFSGRMTSFQVNVDPGKINSGSYVVALELTDVERATEVIDKIVNKSNGESEEPAVEKREAQGFTYWSRSAASLEAQRERRQQRQNRRNKKQTEEEKEAAAHRLIITQASTRDRRGVLGVIDKSLVMCDSIEAFEAAVATYQGETAALQNDQEFIEMSELTTRLLGTEMPCAVYFDNPKHKLSPLLEFAKADSTKEFLSGMSQESELMQSVKGVLDDHELPSMETLQKYMSPQAAFATSDDTGYHLLWFQKRIETEN